MHYSLWLMPEAGSPQERLLTETIENVRQLVLTNHTSREDNQETILEVAPSFLPHLTLLGGISHLCNHKDEEKQQSEEEHIDKIIALTRILARRLPAELPVQPLSSSPASPCAPLDGCPLYYRCLFLPIQPSSTLVKANELAQEIFNTAQPKEEFFPHISLLYADIPQAQKNDIILKLADTKLSDQMASFQATSIHIWNTEGSVKNWSVVAVVPLG